MSGRPRKGRPVAFAPVTPERAQPDPVLGLRFIIEARHGGTVLVDMTELGPRPLAISFASALRRLAALGGPIGAASVVKQYVNAYRHFFTWLSDEAKEVDRAGDLRAAHVDGFASELERGGMGAIHRHVTVGKIVNTLRAIEADRPDRIVPDLHERLRYTLATSAGRSTPRDAYSPFVARALRDAARADVEAIFRRFDAEDRTDEGDPIIARHGAHLHVTDLPPLLVLLSLDTGLEPECLKALRVDCLANPSAGTVELRYLKRRAHTAGHKSMRVRDGGLGTPGGLIRRLIEVTAVARQNLSTDCLWVYRNAVGLHAGIRHPRERLNAWVARHRIVDDDGKPLHLLLSRLRKTHKALWYIKTEGHVARFAVGHSSEVAARHYADLPSLRLLHEATVADAFRDAVAAAMPTILAPAAEKTLRDAPEQAVSLMPPDAVGPTLDGEQDLWLAACTGFHDSPFAKAGSPCQQPFWGCLHCPNAVITARKLPAIMAFLSFVEDQRQGLPGSDWMAKFGQVHARIVHQIMPAFSDAVVAEARLRAAEERLYLPPEARA